MQSQEPSNSEMDTGKNPKKCPSEKAEVSVKRD